MRPLTFRNKLVLGCALAVAVVTGGLVAFWPREPVYEGKPFSYWLDRLPPTIQAVGTSQFVRIAEFQPLKIGSTSFVADAGAFEAVRAVGLQGLPLLLKRLQADRNNKLRQWKYRLERGAVSLHILRPHFRFERALEA